MIKNRLLLKFLLTAAALSNIPGVSSQEIPAQENIVGIMKRVGDYQMSQPWPLHLLEINPYATGPKSWVAGTYYPGIVDLYIVTGDEKYLDYLKGVGESNNWEQGPRLRAADDQAIIQTYLDLYEVVPDPRMLSAAKKMMDATISSPSPGNEEWDWSDALFMAPPIWPHYASITGETSYLDFMDRMWWEAVEALFSKEHRLFYRDKRFRTMESQNGRPVFWSRGNGWVAGSLPRIMKYIPADYPSRPRYEELFKVFAARLKEVQCPDGFWKSSLMDPYEFPFGETSGTGLFCYMFAWGINEGLLEKNEYLPAVASAWNALVACVHRDGKLGFAQGGGDRPYPSRIDHGEPFAVGAFLMAGREMVRLAE